MTLQDSTWDTIKKYGVVIILVGPALVLFTSLVVFPVIQASYYSLFKWKGLGPLSDFRGIQNFIRMFKDPIFIKALWNNVLIVGFSLVVQLPIAFTLALLIGRESYPTAIIHRGIFFFPYILAEIAIGVIWKFIYDPEFGIPTIIASLIFGEGTKIGLLGNLDTAFMAIFLVIFWKYVGFHMILYVAGLQNVPIELEEAALIDGASKAQIIGNVIIPCMKGTIIISAFLSVVGAFNIFDVVWAMGQGGPAHSTETLVTYLYNFGFKRFAFGYGSAVAIVIFLICLVFNLLYQKYVVGGQND
ncbi:carbohydrate ABC transporter permease [Spirochaeta cellobiosiphila]|uniref:carbohydrate ABC transporter permease n=1 Tax=Spirochaeta cellobiosiphila TaxID=504483 RepID=UPI00049101AB|nr:sugar ABC transporter permease [Spirochaeta cellobiosiphila]